MANVKFLRGTLAQYTTASKSSDTFYAIVDANNILTDLYLGEIRLSNAAQITALINSLADVATSGKADDVAVDDVAGNFTATNVEDILAEIATNEGALADLTTTDKSSLVAAINELVTTVSNKVGSVTAANNGIAIGGTTTAPTVGVKISAKTGNNITIETATGEEGLYVNVPAADTYTVKKITTEATYAASYKLYKNYVDSTNPGTAIGDTINIPKDYLVKDAELKTVTAADKASGGIFENDPDFVVGDKYIDFTVNSVDGTGNESHLYLNVNTLVKVYTAAQGATQVQLAIDGSNVISATLVAGGVGSTELAAGAVITAKLANDAVTKEKINADVAGSGLTQATSGALDVNCDTTTIEVNNSGVLKVKDNTFDSYGSAAAVLGTASDTKTDNTVFGAKAYADDKVDSALTWGTI